MNFQLTTNAKIFQEPYLAYQIRREQIKQEIRRRIDEALQSTKNLSPNDCLSEIRDRLSAIQQYCQSTGKSFYFVEVAITCDQYELGGCHQDGATLFRGPSDDASVAICITYRGSLLHRNNSPWKIYRNMGDIHPVEYYSSL